MPAETEQQDSPAEPTLAELAEQAARTGAERAEEQAENEEHEEQSPGDDAADEGGEGVADDEQDDPKGLVKLFDQTFGRQEAEKFKNDMEFLRAYDELLTMRGRRDEDASLGKQVRERLGKEPDELLTLLKAGGDTPEKPAEESLEFDQSWVRTDDNGNVVPVPGAPPDTMQRYAAWRRQYDAFAKNPNGFVEKKAAAVVERLEKRLEQLSQEIEQRQQEQTDQAQQREQELAVQAWSQRNQRGLYLDGDPEKGLTTHGQRLIDLADEFIDPAKHDVTKALDTLWATVVNGAPKPSKRSVSSRATRKPSVATRPAAEMDDKQLEDQLAKKGLAAVLAEQAAAAE